MDRDEPAFSMGPIEDRVDHESGVRVEANSLREAYVRKVSKVLHIMRRSCGDRKFQARWIMSSLGGVQCEVEIPVMAFPFIFQRRRAMSGKRGRGLLERREGENASFSAKRREGKTIDAKIKIMN